jgi:ElaB/YqjD/DUF883 family membrane-anchored ribosome-binding protein
MEEKNNSQDIPMDFPERAVSESTFESSGSKFSNLKTSVSDSLRSAAAAIRDKAEGASENSNLSHYGHQASRWLNASADYVRDMEFHAVKSDIEETVRRNPGRSLVIAAAAGLIIGTMFRRR